jgi:hypothetical protein
MSYPETGHHKFAQGESLHVLKPPTCEKYEPYFEKVFDIAQSGIMNGKDIVTPEGNIVASVWHDELLFDVKNGFPVFLQMQRDFSILVKIHIDCRIRKN